MRFEFRFVFEFEFVLKYGNRRHTQPYMVIYQIQKSVDFCLKKYNKVMKLSFIKYPQNTYMAYIKCTQPNYRLCQFYVGRVHFIQIFCHKKFE